MIAILSLSRFYMKWHFCQLWSIVDLVLLWNDISVGVFFTINGISDEKGKQTHMINLKFKIRNTTKRTIWLKYVYLSFVTPSLLILCVFFFFFMTIGPTLCSLSIWFQWYLICQILDNHIKASLVIFSHILPISQNYW